VANQDQVKGKMNESMGAVKEKAGSFTGDRDMEAEGNAQKNQGKVEGAWGKVKDAASDAVDSVKDTAKH
jgi:uncharacterized protein YjbJ (UPF0337 family)